ncbi:MAG: DUF669 domain-containing protein [Porphyromonadaceae bacterium]|nr:DUF669 domain-containing protein [Porphyromonadaceae bacterium]
MIDFNALMSLDVAESMSFEPLPKGLYKVTVDACELGESKKGNPMYTVDFVVTEGEHAARQIRYWLVVVTKSGLHWDLPKFCTASGNPWPTERTERTTDYYYQVALDIVGKTATITVDVEESEYNGETRKRNNIKKVEWDDVKKKSKASKIEL